MVKDKKNAIILLVSLSAILIPFINKAIHIDDPFWIWTAQNIQANPFDFYGYRANWYGFEEWGHQIAKAPPLFSYYLCLFSSVFGWSEISLHVASFIPALFLVLGIYSLAEKLTSHAVLATLISVSTPLFLLPSTAVMADIMMLALWVWSFLFWARGMNEDHPSSLIVSAILCGLCALTKYNGISLILLLVLYSLLIHKPKKLFYLLIPILMLVSFETWFHHLYGHGLLTSVTGFSSSERNFHMTDIFVNTGVLMSFLGGSLVSGVLFLPLIWKPSNTLKIIMVGFVLGTVLLALGIYTGRVPWEQLGPKNSFVFQLILWVSSGIMVLPFLRLKAPWKKDNWGIVFLCWFLGTLFFAGFINWSVTSRAMLPVVPLWGILVVRALEQKRFFDKAHAQKKIWVLGGISLCITLAVAIGDYRWAGASKWSARQIKKSLENHANTVWFQGHWGLQYYFEKVGFKPMDTRTLNLAADDIILIPINNTNIAPLPPHRVVPAGHVRKPINWFCMPMNSLVQAGFYSDRFGLLPYFFGKIPDEIIWVYQVQS